MTRTVPIPFVGGVAGGLVLPVEEPLPSIRWQTVTHHGPDGAVTRVQRYPYRLAYDPRDWQPVYRLEPGMVLVAECGTFDDPPGGKP